LGDRSSGWNFAEAGWVQVALSFFLRVVSPQMYGVERCMSRLCNAVRVLVVVSLLCHLALPRAEGQSNDINRILNRLSGYHMLTLLERNADARAFILAHVPKNNPSVVHADFDGDGHSDYAILIKDNKSGTTKLVVLLCSGDARCKNVYEMDVTSDAGEVYIRPVLIGSRVSQTGAIDTNDYPAPVRLSSSGIELTYFGQAKVVYYWNKKHKKIESVQTAD
jgi:hypothetical protein